MPAIPGLASLNVGALMLAMPGSLSPGGAWAHDHKTQCRKDQVPPRLDAGFSAREPLIFAGSAITVVIDFRAPGARSIDGWITSPT